MYYLKQSLSKKDKSKVSMVIDELPVCDDFYITKNNLRLYIKENKEKLFKSLKQGNKIAFSREGVAIITGYADKMNRKYLKISAKNLKVAGQLIKFLSWNTQCDLYCKIKKNNPLKDVLLHSGFSFLGGRGKEILYVKNIRRINNDFKIADKGTQPNSG